MVASTSSGEACVRARGRARPEIVHRRCFVGQRQQSGPHQRHDLGPGQGDVGRRYQLTANLLGFHLRQIGPGLRAVQR